MPGLNRYILFILFMFIVMFPGVLNASSAPFKILVVMSCHDGKPWEDEMREGMEGELLKKLGIKLRPVLLVGTELVETEER